MDGKEYNFGFYILSPEFSLTKKLDIILNSVLTSHKTFCQYFPYMAHILPWQFVTLKWQNKFAMFLFCLLHLLREFGKKFNKRWLFKWFASVSYWKNTQFNIAFRLLFIMIQYRYSVQLLHVIKKVLLILYNYDKDTQRYLKWSEKLLCCRMGCNTLNLLLN